MKTDIHPKYFENATIRCSCGNIIVAGSTKESLKTELCSKCHPFYTGQQKLVDTAGRVDKFEARRKKAQLMLDEAKQRTEDKKKKPEVYVEKVIPQKVLERVEEKEKGKWGSALGETLTSETIKENKLSAKKSAVKSAAKSAVKSAAKSAVKSAAKSAVKKAPVKKTSAKKTVPAKKTAKR